MGNIYYFISIFLFGLSCNQKENTSSSVVFKTLNYPSASSVEFYNGKLYVMGDDATDLLVLDTNLNVIDSIHFVDYSRRRIPKDIKHDLEASALITGTNDAVLFLFGSGSLSPYRNKGWRYFFDTNTKDSISLQHPYDRIKQSGIEQINIEGACFIGDSLMLVSRGNKSYPRNYLIITDKDFWNNDSSFNVEVIPPGKADTSSFKGISGLCYSKPGDQLIMTVSTEDTRSAHEDGAIGKSYLWIIDSISKKTKSKTVTPNNVIDLEEIDPRFKGQKIESAIIIEETKEILRLVLVADNDDESSTIFKMSIKKD